MEKLSSSELGAPMGGPPEKAGPPEGDSELEMHAGAFASAVKRGDKKAIANAFRAMKQACEAEGYEDGGTDDFGI
jgi:hypothetical protein